MEQWQFSLRQDIQNVINTFSGYGYDIMFPEAVHSLIKVFRKYARDLVEEVDTFEFTLKGLSSWVEITCPYDKKRESEADYEFRMQTLYKLFRFIAGEDEEGFRVIRHRVKPESKPKEGYGVTTT